MQVDLMRHSTPNIPPGLCYGQSEVPLAPSFPREKAVILKQLNTQYDAVFSSPLSRCTQLAQQIPTQIYQLDARLLEMNFGVWELKKWDEVDKQALDIWMSDFVNRSVEAGESFQQLYQRVVAFIEALLTADYQTVAIVTHAGVIRCFWAWVLEMPLRNTFRLHSDYGEIHRLVLNPQKDECLIINKGSNVLV